jgi:O-antigen/teichoic acid export membrane protein
MSEIVDNSFSKIAKVTGIVFLGNIIGMGLAFLGRVLVARFFTQVDYGIFSLGYVILNVLVVISLLGLQDGVARQIGYYRGKNDMLKVRGIISSSIQMVFLGSLILLTILFFTSDSISIKVFHEPRLSTPLKVFAFAIPFFAILQLLVSIFRGFERVKERVYFQSIGYNALFPIFLIPVLFFHLPFINVIYAFTASIGATCVILIFYVIRRFYIPLNRDKRLLINDPIGKELLFFSVPLLIVYMLAQVMNWTDTLMLGYFTTSELVGLYNAAVPLATIIITFLYSSHFIVIPVAAKLYSQNLMLELKRNYQILTKWILFAVFPIFFIFVFFPEIVINSLFGVNYVKASVALQILAVCFLIQIVLGPCGATLLSMGKSKFMMSVGLIGASLNVFSNAVLIPIWGIEGAAIATALSLLTVHTLYSINLYRISKIHPFTKNYLTPLSASTLIISLVYLIVKSFISVTIWLIPLLFVTFIAICILVLLLSKGIEEEDVTLLLEIERKSGMKLTPIKEVLKRFT